QQPCQCDKGTSMVVKNLFFNIPARRNFLKKDTIEMAHIEEVFRRVALVNHKVAFAFYSNDKMLYDLKAGNFAQRIVSLFGDVYKERLFPVDETSDVVRVSGYVCRPEFTRKRRGEQYVFCNERFIKHSGISGAVESAYNDLIPERSFPSYFLSLEVEPSRIDVNIHPTKTEVRFIDEHAILAIVHAATKKALGQFSLASEIDFDPGEELAFHPLPKGIMPKEPHVTVNPTFSPFCSKKEEQEAKNEWNTFFETEETTQPQQVRLIDANLSTLETETHADNGILGFAGRYIITTLPSGLIAIDQQRAWERITYDQLVERMQKKGGMAGAQQLLFPVNCIFSAADADIVTELMPDLKMLGFEIEPLGQNTFVVSATPADVNDGQLQELLASMVSDYKNSMMQRFNDRDKSLCLALARQMAADKCKPLQTQEMQNLIASLFACSSPTFSPSGKKILITMTEDDLREKFQ
ncbi:MAG: DNA mismatch repair endonuclease MutL, partial [Bacteroidales bacterium]|nr:DNA mismatch repair endonuclease MutL [Bacteroidales bacterium]